MIDDDPGTEPSSPSTGYRITDRALEGRHGTIPIRVYASTVSHAGLVWVHGGGFAFGDLDMPESDWVARQLAERGISVITVDYRLAPPWEGEAESDPDNDRAANRYPVASEEVFAAFLAAPEIEPGPPDGCWAIGGASAGGNLAVSAALRLRDGRFPGPCALVLAYPLLHAALPPLSDELSSRQPSVPDELWFPPAVIARMNLNYVGSEALLAEPYAFPGGSELSGLPPTLVINSDRDTIRASGEAFAQELIQAGVDVTLTLEPGSVHGHLNDPQGEDARRSVDTMAAWLPANSHSPAHPLRGPRMTPDTYSPAVDRYDSMQYNRVGRSGLRLPALSLGLWHNFGDTRDLATQRAIVRRAFDLGITHFDLANIYGPPEGSAELGFGRILAQDLSAHRDELVLTTKAGYFMHDGPYGEWGSAKHLRASLDRSLIRLGVDYVDIYYSHRLDPETPLEETMGALATAVRSGKALYAGVSNYSPEQTRQAAAILGDLGVPLTVHQPSYSMFNRHVEHGLLEVLDEVRAGAVVYSPLEQGLLTDRYLDGSVPPGSRAAAASPFLTPSDISETYLERARALNDIAQRRGQTLAQLALSWVLRQPQVASAIIGASSVTQLEQNVSAAAAIPLSPAEVEIIDLHAIDGTKS